MLGDVRSNADLVIDTTNLNVHQLTDRIAQAFGTPDATRLKVTVISFGFKYGIPVDADFVADMRFLPNPLWVPELRPLTGRDDAGRRLRQEPAGRGRVPRRATSRSWSGSRGATSREGKRFMTVAIGCTGGKHRSVAMTEEIARRLGAEGYDVRATHRDLGRE